MSAVTIVGIGYVGLPLAVAAAAAGYDTYGLDVSMSRVAQVNAGCSPVDTVTDQQLRAVAGRLLATTDPACLDRGGYVVICVPTMASAGAPPDLSALLDAAGVVGRYLRRGQCVIVESTTYPGSTDGPVRQALERTGLRAGTDFALAYSPERIDPGNLAFELANTPKLIGGITDGCARRAGEFYARFVTKICYTKGTREAEAAKILENTYRQVNIALVNEFALLAQALEFDIWDTVRAAATKPFGFASFRPGPGVGGHCIPVAPHFLAARARMSGMRFHMAEAAHEINEGVPAWIAGRLCAELGRLRVALEQAHVLLLGATYKPGVADGRNAPTPKILRELRARGVEVSFHDPYLSVIDVDGSDLKRVSDLKQAMGAADITVLVQPHPCYDAETLASARLLFDTTGIAGQAGFAGRAIML